MIKKNTVFLNGRKIGTYEFVQKAGSGHIINFNGFDPYEAKLTDNQQVVLDWLKWKRQEGSQPIECLYALAFGDAIESVIIAYINLTDTEQFQVLAAFAEWGSKEEQS